jgi:NADPH:quinone reductase
VKAWQYVQHGAPAQVLRLVDVQDPMPGSGQVLVQVEAAAVNFADALVVRGTYQSSPPLPAIAGMEVTGTVVAAGAGARLGVGTRVCGLTPHQAGAFAQLAVLDVADAFVPPDSFTPEQAAGFTSAYQTAWFAVHVRGRVSRGEAVVVHAAAGAVGTAAVQLAAAAGAHVVGVVGSAEKAATALAAGCEHVVLRSADDVVAQLKDATRGGADVVIDPVGGNAHAISERIAAFDARIVVLGFASGVVPPVRADLVMVKNISVIGLHWGLYRSRAPEVVVEQNARLCAQVQAHGLVPEVSAVLSRDELPNALATVEQGRSTGRVVVQMTAPGQPLEPPAPVDPTHL